MTSAAWIMLTATWGTVIGVAGYLFWKVLVTPRKDDDR